MILWEREFPFSKCYVLLSPTVGQIERFLHNPPFFNISSAADQSTSLLTRISLDQYLESKWIFSPLDISTQPQVRRKTQAGRVFSQMIWFLDRCVHCKVANVSSKTIHVIEWSLCFFTRIPSFLYQDQTLLSFPAVIISSNSSSNIPRCDTNEPIFFFLLPKDYFWKFIFRRVIRGNHRKYIPCSLLLPFSSQSRLISSWNISLSQSISISSVIWLEEHIAAEQLDESTVFFGNLSHFYIFAEIYICINIHWNNGLEEGEGGLFWSRFYWIS